MRPRRGGRCIYTDQRAIPDIRALAGLVAAGARGYSRDARVDL